MLSWQRTGKLVRVVFFFDHRGRLKAEGWWRQTRDFLNMERIPLPSPEEAQDLILSTLKKPTILETPTGSWARNQPFWTPSNLGQVAGETRTEFRVWPRQLSCLVWENECKHVGCSFSEFSDWLDREELGPDDEYRHNPFRAASLTTQDVCVYAAYKNMEEIFGSESIFSKAVTWEPFGFKGRGSRQTTFWCGTNGSYTPCHFDTYGCNVVVQLHGHKRWTLFSPDDTPYLYSTRLPYEESSVFSEVNIGQPDLDEHPLFRKATPIQVRVFCFSTFPFQTGIFEMLLHLKTNRQCKMIGAALDWVSWHKLKSSQMWREFADSFLQKNERALCIIAVQILYPPECWKEAFLWIIHPKFDLYSCDDSWVMGLTFKASTVPTYKCIEWAQSEEEASQNTHHVP